MKRVLITGAGGPAGVNFTLSLKLADEGNIYTVGTEANEHHLLMTRTDRSFIVPRSSDPTYIDSLNEIIRREEIELLYAQTDEEVKAISENRDRLLAETFLPEEEAIEICQDKLKTAERLKRKGVPVPKTVVIDDEADIDEALSLLGAPFWMRARYGAGGKGSTPVFDFEEGSAWFRYWMARKEGVKFVAQEYLSGRNIAFHGLFGEGELIASMARERLEYIYPNISPSGITGTPSVQRTIHSDEVNRIAYEAVLAIDEDYNGIASVDLKEDKEGNPKVTEINAGRTFTTSFFFSYAGKILYRRLSMPVSWFANIPYLWVKMAYGERLPKLKSYNMLPKDLFWIRHIDIPARILFGKEILGEMYHFQIEI